jgi:GMP synthase PP-ATPase subunit
MTIHNIPLNQTLLPENSNSTDDEDKKEIRREFIKMLFNELKTTQKEYIHDAFTLYEDFVEHGLIVISDGQKKTLYNIMLKETIQDIKFKIHKSSSTSLKKEMQSILKNIDKDKNSNAINRSKAYLVCTSIKSFISDDAILKKINL